MDQPVSYARTLYNDPKDYVDEALAGMVAIHHDHYGLSSTDPRVVTAISPSPQRKAGVISLGGFGHLPIFAGYVGAGLLDACAVGNVFASPSAKQIANAARAANRGAGVVAVVGNYGGDVMNAKLATGMLAAEGIQLETALVTDDVASAAPEQRLRRRGVAGTVFAMKIAGAAADEGRSAQEVRNVAIKAVANCRSFGVALSPCTVPTSGRPTFDIPAGEMDFGMGIHGEPGILRRARQGADEVTDFLLDRIIDDYGDDTPRHVALLVNSLGATPIEELFILARRAVEKLSALGVTVRWQDAGRFATSMEMAGASVTLLELDDDLAKLLDAPASCPFWRVSK